MTMNVACCTPDSRLEEIARLMVEHDCGEIPVIEEGEPVGVITDRDIVCRLIARGKNPIGMKARDCMSSPVVTVTPDMNLEECCRIMEQNRIRRVPVVDESGGCCGMVSQADIARRAPERKAGEVVREVSQPAASAHAA